MPLSLLYLLERFLYRILDFFRHWYVHSAKLYANFILDQLSELDRSLAWRITLQHFFQPLYKDYSFTGRVLGVVFRALRLAVGAAVYAGVFVFAVFLFILWALLPPFLIWQIFTSSSI